MGSQCGRWNCSHRRPLTERGSALRLLPGTLLKHSPLETLVRGLGDGGGKGTGGRGGGAGGGGEAGDGGDDRLCTIPVIGKWFSFQTLERRIDLPLQG